MHKVLLFVLVWLGGSVAVAVEPSRAHYQLSLENQKKLNQAIAVEIQKIRTQESEIEQTLRVAETKVNQNNYKAYGLDIEATRLQRAQGKTQGLRQKIQAEIAVRQQLLLEQMRFSYLAGGPTIVQVLLGGKTMEQAGPVSAWYQYLGAKKYSELQALSLRLQKQRTLETSLAAQQEALRVNRQQRKQVAITLMAEEKAMQKLLQSLAKTLQSQEARLQIGKKEQQQLSQLLAHLEISLAGTPMVPMDLKAFVSRKGLLTPPVARQKMRKMKGSKAVVFAARAGSEVVSIAAGRVVFADWVRGYGLLTIVDHGSGYMSLYGRNKVLLKSRGEWVRSGELLAKVGGTGGLAGAGLFFELRLRGKSVSLRSWFKRG